MFEIGDIVEIYAATAGRDKYHLCVKVGTDGAATQFLFLNSNPNFAGLFVTECERVPCIPKSKTGKTCMSFNAMPRYNDRQLELYGAKKIGVLDKALAVEIYEFAKIYTNTKGLGSADRSTALTALKMITEKYA